MTWAWENDIGGMIKKKAASKTQEQFPLKQLLCQCGKQET